MKVVIFTRTAFHHTYFINRLQERFEVACVVRESYPPERKKKKSLKELFGRHLLQQLRDERFLSRFHLKFSAGFKYHKILGEYLRSPFDAVEERHGTKYLNVPHGGINNPDFEILLHAMRPDIIAVLGSSVIMPQIISVPSAAMMNLHSGLSPYYRGTWSYGWPIVNAEPEYIGVTVHHVDPGIDSGNIIYQTRPSLAESDDLNTIFLKVIAEGTELVARAIEEIIERGSVVSHEQTKGAGRLYLTADFNADVARRCFRNLKRGVLGEYLSRRETRDSKVKLFGYVAPKFFR
jgi:methionyl-tRNA formyltransferase